MNDLLPLALSAARLTLGAAFLLAGLTKWLDPSGLITALSGLRLFPAPALPALAGGLALTESLLGAALLLNVLPRSAAAGGFVLLLAFTAFLILQYRRGERQGCGCFGSAHRDRIGPASFARNAGLLGLAAVVFFTPDASPNPWWAVMPLLIAIAVLAKRLARPQAAPQAAPAVPASSRRDFLRRLGQTSAALLGVALLERLGLRPVLAQYYCPCTQTYDHYEAWCNTQGCSGETRRHHVYTRTCEPCACGCNTNQCCSLWSRCSCSCISCDQCRRDSRLPCCTCGYDCYYGNWTCHPG